MIYGSVSSDVSYTLYTSGVVSPCTDITLTGTITVSPVPELAIGDDILCVGETTTLTSSVAGSWTSSNELVAEVEGNVVTALGAGWASLVFTADGSGCSNTLTVTVNALPVVTAEDNGPVCIGSTLQLTGGTAGMTSYSWVGPNGFASSEQNSSIPGVTEEHGGTYTLTVTNSSGCVSTATTTVVVNPLPEVTAESNSPLCLGSTLILTAGTVTGTYTWELPNGTTISTTSQELTIPDVTADYAGTCTLTLTDLNGCSSTATTVVSFLPEPMVSFGFNGVEVGWNASFTYCQNDNIVVTLFKEYAGKAPYSVTYNIDGGSSTTVPGLDAGEPIGSSSTLTPGTHTITVTDITDANGCKANASFLANCVATLVINPAATLELEPGSGPAYQEICLGDSIESIIFRINGGAYGFDLKVSDFGGLTVEGDIEGDDLIVTLSGTTSETVEYELTTDGTLAPCVEESEKITIVVNRIPQFTVCPANIETVDDQGMCTAVVNYEVLAFGSSTISYTYTLEGAGAETVSPTGEGTGSGADFRTGTTTVTVVAANDCGTASCTFTVKVTDNQKPEFTENCSKVFEAAADWDKATYTMTSNVWDAVATDNCSVVMSYSSNNGATPATGSTLSGTTFSIGETTVIWTVTDAGGNVVSCTSVVNVIDNQPPVIECVTDAVLSSNKKCDYLISTTEFDPPVVWDNAGIVKQEVSLDNGGSWQTTTTLNGMTFKGGVNQVIWKVTDVGGLTASCTFTVTVIDDQKPTFDACGETFCVTLKPEIIRNRFGVFIIAKGYLYDDVVRQHARDNCTEPSMLKISYLWKDKLYTTPLMFTDEDGGDHLVKVFVEDMAENSDSCCIIVTVPLPFKKGEIGTAGVTEDVWTDLSMTVYPNPTRGKVFVDIRNLNDPKVMAKVFNAAGAMVFSREFTTGGKIEIDLTGNVSGMYLLRLNADKREFMHKIILDNK